VRYDRNAIDQANLAHLLAGYQPPPWCTDIQTQVEHFNDFVKDILHTQCPIRKKERKKTLITPDIWRLHERKLKLQKQAKLQRQAQSRELLAQIFRSWNNTLDDSHLAQSQRYGTTLLETSFKTCVALLRTTRSLRKASSTAKQAQVQVVINDLPMDCASSIILNNLKPIVGTTNPKLQRSSPLPMVLTTRDNHVQRQLNFVIAGLTFLERWKMVHVSRNKICEGGVTSPTRRAPVFDRSGIWRFPSDLYDHENCW
jgi:hypothetical protein